MRCVFTVLFVSVLLVQAPKVNAADEPSEIPLRKAGLWEVQTTTDEGRGTQNQTLTMCIGGEMERSTVLASIRENRSSCSKYEIRKTAEGTTVDAVCVYDERQVTNHNELRGDFTTGFEVKVVSATTGNAPRAQGGMPVNVSRMIVQKGRYLGESCGELHAGEAKTAAGQTVTVQ
jgi:hypothetical protein